jgi:hypothetical protein
LFAGEEVASVETLGYVGLAAFFAAMSWMLFRDALAHERPPLDDFPDASVHRRGSRVLSWLTIAVAVVFVVRAIQVL